MSRHEHYMRRCIELAGRAAGNTAPNPMVGAVLVHNGVIIGEGWHKQYGEAHAEINCINDAVSKGYQALLPAAQLYVSLEPCAHFGKTPPCADRIVQEQIPEVYIGCRDPFSAVNGKGIEKLKEAGIKVVTDVLEKDCRELNKRFFTFHEQQRPYVLLKWAQTADGYIAGQQKTQRLHISTAGSNRLVHRWRTEEAAILIGTNTALYDNPHLTARLWPGPSPLRVIVDMQLRLPASLHVFDRTVKTLVVNAVKDEKQENIIYHKIDADGAIVPQILQTLYSSGLLSVMVEGGGQLLQTFIDSGQWDEARVIKSSIVKAGDGLPAPLLQDCKLAGETNAGNDSIAVFFKS